MNNTIRKFKQRKIQKAQLGTILKKGWDWFKNSNQVASIAESPAVMTASGWRVDSRTGKTRQDQQNTKEVEQLRSNLNKLGQGTLAATTVTGDIEGLYNIARHPIQTGKTIYNASKTAIKKGKDIIQSFKNRTDVNMDRIYPENGWVRMVIDDTERNKVFRIFDPYRDIGKRKYSTDQLKRIYLETKKDVYNYYHSPEFKERAFNAGFTKEEYPRLMAEINNHLKNTKFDPSKIKKSTAVGQNSSGWNPLSKRHSYYKVRLTRKPQSKENIRAITWHELAHSIAGKNNKESPIFYPMLDKLRTYNDNIVPINRNDFIKILENNPSKIQNFVEKQGFGKEYSKVFANHNQKQASIIGKDLNKSVEARSRMAATLDYLRHKGYDTSKLIKNPQLFKQWIIKLRQSEANVSSNLNRLLQNFTLDDLSKYSSKILTTSGAIYSGDKMLNNK